MNVEGRKTATLWSIALALAACAWATAPRTATPDALSGRGELLFPAFRDPNSAASLEVITFDASSATVRPFKVQNRNGRWTIPSQHDYPTDAKEPLATTAAALIAMRRDDFVSNNAADHEKTGVLDPLDATLPTLNGRGTRLIARDANDRVLADVIVGSEVQRSPGFRYVRMPGQSLVYASHVGELKTSVNFYDWIEQDLLQVEPLDINAVSLRNYALNRNTGVVNPGETLLLQKPADGNWTFSVNGRVEDINLDAADGLLRNLARLRIVGVLPKPEGITATLRSEVASATMTASDREDLARKGFYLAANGELVSNRGEMVVRTIRGVFYTLRFGDVAPLTDAATVNDQQTSAGSKGPKTQTENRYLFIMVDFDPQAATSPDQAKEGEAQTRLLRARFAPWYYLISGDSFSAIQLGRRDLARSRRSP